MVYGTFDPDPIDPDPISTVILQVYALGRTMSCIIGPKLDSKLEMSCIRGLH